MLVIARFGIPSSLYHVFRETCYSMSSIMSLLPVLESFLEFVSEYAGIDVFFVSRGNVIVTCCDSFYAKDFLRRYDGCSFLGNSLKVNFMSLAWRGPADTK